MLKKKISHYEILEMLGEGGMGVVYKALDTERGKTVALKVMSRRSLPDEDVKRRFLREAGAGARLHHPNIVKVYEVGEEEGEHFISMEYVEGNTLRHMLKEGSLPPKKVIEIGIAVCEALKEAHKMGIIHRDIKSENVMLTCEGDVKVMDFGLAKIQEASMLTQEGMTLGTPAYMSPEQAIGEAVDQRSDIFSLGIVLYELLTGKLPFTGDYELAVIYCIINEEPMGMRELSKDVPKELEQVVVKALRKELQHRYQSVDELTGDLRKVKSFLEGETMPPADLGLVADVELGKIEERGVQVKLAGRRGFEAKLAGRDEQFDTLKTLVRRTNLGEGQTVFIAGEAGIGKSRLVWELEKFARTLKIRMLTGRCVFRQGIYPYQPFVEAIRDYFQIKGVKSSEMLEEFIGDKAPELMHQLPVIRLFLNIKEKEEIAIESKEQLWDAIFRLIVKISEERTLILFIDDLHWADEDTINLFYYASRNTTASKVMMVSTYRPEDIRATSDGRAHPLSEVQQEMNREGILTVIDLARLVEDDIQEMVCSLFQDSDFGKPFYSSLYRETEGNPFFVMETLKLLKMEGVIQKENGGYRLREDYDRIDIPSKIHDIVMRRIERLKEDEREILEIGAVEGEAFHSDTISSCLGINRIQLLRKLQSLGREHHIIYPQEKMYRFDHGKIREFLYDAVTPELRVEYHLMIGDHLTKTYEGDERLAPNIAHHFLEGGYELRAQPFLVTAGERARALFANERAIEFYQKALGITQRLEKSGSPAGGMEGKDIILEGLGDVWSLTGSHEDALEKYGALTNLSDVPTLRRIELFRKMGTVYVNKGENEKALELLLQAERELGKQQGAIKQGERPVESGVVIPEEMDLRKPLGKIKITRAHIHKTQGHYEEARNEIEEGLALLGDEGDLKERGEAYNNLGNIYYDQGNYNQAVKMHTDSLKVREEIGDKKGIAEAYNNLANVYYEQGNYGESAKMLEKGLVIMNEIGFRVGIAGTCNNLGTIYQDQGRYQEALTMHEKSLAIREQIGDMPGVAMSYGNLGEVDLDLGNLSRAKERLEKSIELQKEMGLRVFESQAHAWLGLVLVELGQLGEAKQIALKALNVASEMNQKGSEGIAKRVLAMIRLEQLKGEGGNSLGREAWKEIGMHLRETLEIFQELNMEHEVGRSYLELARFSQLFGDAAEGHTYLLRAKEIFKKLGASGDYEKAKKLEVSMSK